MQIINMFNALLGSCTKPITDTTDSEVFQDIKLTRGSRVSRGLADILTLKSNHVISEDADCSPTIGTGTANVAFDLLVAIEHLKSVSRDDEAVDVAPIAPKLVTNATDLEQAVEPTDCLDTEAVEVSKVTKNPIKKFELVDSLKKASKKMKASLVVKGKTMSSAVKRLVVKKTRKVSPTDIIDESSEPSEPEKVCQSLKELTIDVNNTTPAYTGRIYKLDATVENLWERKQPTTKQYGAPTRLVVLKNEHYMSGLCGMYTIQAVEFASLY